MSAVNPPIPADVIVDTWNLRNQAGDVLGSNRFPDIPGIVTALAAYGFDVQHVYAAAACTPYSDRPSQRVQKALATTEPFVRHMKAAPNGTLLEGKLTDRSGSLEEKLVDVLCAVQIARCAMRIVTGLSSARAIVVISEDIDLTPAYTMARELGVPVYAGANETVHTRPGDWLIFSDATMIEMGGRPHGDVGAQRKTLLAKQLLTADMHRQFSFRYLDRATGLLVFRHRTGIEGVLPASESPAQMSPGDALQLYPVDLYTAPAASGFPALLLSTTAPVSSRAQHLLEGEVVEWLQPTRVRVELNGGTRAYEAAPGTLLPRMKVAVHCQPSSRRRLVGGLERIPTLPEWGTPSLPRIATVEAQASRAGATVRASVDGLSTPVALLPPGEDVASVGSRYAVVPRDHDAGRVTKVIAVSSALRGKY